MLNLNDIVEKLEILSIISIDHLSRPNLSTWQAGKEASYTGRMLGTFGDQLNDG